MSCFWLMLIFTNTWEKTSGSLAALFVCQALYRLYNQNNKLKGSKKGYANTHMIQWMYFLWVWTKWNESISLFISSSWGYFVKSFPMNTKYIHFWSARFTFRLEFTTFGLSHPLPVYRVIHTKKLHRAEGTAAGWYLSVGSSLHIQVVISYISCVVF